MMFYEINSLNLLKFLVYLSIESLEWYYSVFKNSLYLKNLNNYKNEKNYENLKVFVFVFLCWCAY